VPLLSNVAERVLVISPLPMSHAKSILPVIFFNLKRPLMAWAHDGQTLSLMRLGFVSSTS